MPNHIQLSIEANQEQQEILISQLSDLNATGFEQTNSHLLAYFDESSFPSYDINQLLEGYKYVTHTVEEQNWNAVWESNFEPVVIDEFVAVRAHFHEPIPQVQHEILITPKMSFGTGHHATTHMMIEQMRSIDFKDKSVFDFGTGTGVLAILAEKLGASTVDAIDNDEWSIDNAAENIQKNHCVKVDVRLSSTIDDTKQYDIILANINRNVIIKYLPYLTKALKPEGYILFSGLLNTDEDDMRVIFHEHSLKFIKQLERSKWISLLYVNKK